MKWLGSWMLAHFPQLHRSSIVTPDRELEETRRKHNAGLRRADRALNVIEEYRKLDGVLQVYVRRRGG